MCEALQTAMLLTCALSLPFTSVAVLLINVPILEMPLQRDIIHRHCHLWANVNYATVGHKGGAVQRCVHRESAEG